MKKDLAYRALHNVILCSPRIVAPLALMSVETIGSGALTVESNRIGVPDGVPLERLGHMVAEGVVHVILGHPVHLAGAKAGDEGAALQAAYRLRACRIIADCAGMPGGMFLHDDAVEALASALRAKGVEIDVRAVDDIHRSVLAAMADDGVARLVADVEAVVRAGDIPGDVHGLAALGAARAQAAGSRWELLHALTPLVGEADIEDAALEATATAVLDLMDVPTTVAEAKEALAVARGIEGLDVPRQLVASAVLEALLKRLKRLGVRGTELATAFRDEAVVNAELSLGDGPIIDL
jgi:hypothetical protein